MTNLCCIIIEVVNYKIGVIFDTQQKIEKKREFVNGLIEVASRKRHGSNYSIRYSRESN